MSLTLSEYFGVEKLVQFYLEDTQAKRELTKRRLLIYHHGSKGAPNTALRHLLQILPRYGVSVTRPSSKVLLIARNSDATEQVGEDQQVYDQGSPYAPSSWCITHFPSESLCFPEHFVEEPPPAPELPSKVLRYIFTLLDRAVDLIAAGGVSRKWAAISRSDSLWEKHLHAVADVESRGSTLFMGEQEGLAQRVLRRYGGGGKRRGYLRRHYLLECIPYPKRNFRKASRCSLPSHRNLPLHAHFVSMEEATQSMRIALDESHDIVPMVTKTKSPMLKRKTRAELGKKPVDAEKKGDGGPDIRCGVPIKVGVEGFSASDHSIISERYRAERVSLAVSECQIRLEEQTLKSAVSERTSIKLQWEVAALHTAIRELRTDSAASDTELELQKLRQDIVELNAQMRAKDARVEKYIKREKSCALEILNVRDDIERIYEDKLTLKKQLRDTQKLLERERSRRESEQKKVTELSTKQKTSATEAVLEESDLDEEDARVRLKRKDEEIVRLKTELLRLGDTIDKLSEKLTTRVPSTSSSEFSKMKSRAARYEKEAKAGRTKIANLQQQLEQQQKNFFSEDVPEEEEGTSSSGLSLTSPFPGIRLHTVEPAKSSVASQPSQHSLSDLLAKVAKQKQK